MSQRDDVGDDVKNDLGDVEDDPYLWDRSGHADPTVKKLEALLAPLAMKDVPTPMPEPAAPVVELAPRRMRPRTIAIGALALAAVALLSFFAGRSSRPEVAAIDASPTANASANIATAASSVASSEAPKPPDRSMEGALAYETLSGTAMCDSSPRAEKGLLALGAWLETDGETRVMLEVADLGHVEIAPRTKLRILPGNGAEHRLELHHGTIHARINAPPRVFVVETQAATAVDLGCVYTLEVGEDGRGLLRVGRGEVALERRGASVVVKRGEVAEMRPGFGPGTPFWADASTDLRKALGAWDFDRGPLAPVLDAASTRDGLTLTHVLERVDDRNDRKIVVDRIVALVPAAKSVDAKALVGRDKDALAKLVGVITAK